jgi:hypothetical protein
MLGKPIGGSWPIAPLRVLTLNPKEDFDRWGQKISNLSTKNDMTSQFHAPDTVS